MTASEGQNPRNQGAGSRLWAEGRIVLWVEGPRFPARSVTIQSPYAVIGRVLGCDVRIPHPDISARHMYLHVDQRGVFAVDLATRTGSRFLRAEDPEGLGLVSIDSWTDHRDERTAWLKIGESFLIADHKIEIVKARVEHDSALVQLSEMEPIKKGLPNLLGDTSPNAPLVGVTLAPLGSDQLPQALTSELVFVGSSGSCGVRIDDRSLPRIQAVLVRSAAGAYLVNLSGRDAYINGEPIVKRRCS